MSRSAFYHQFAGDIQLVIAKNACDAVPEFNRLADCSSALHLWFLWNGLQLNTDKSEVVIFGTSHQLRAAANIQTIDVAGSRLVVSDQVKSIGGVTVDSDSHLRFDCHASNVARACNYHTRALRHVRSAAVYCPTRWHTDSRVQYRRLAARLDYCNALLYCMANRYISTFSHSLEHRIAIIFV